VTFVHSVLRHGDVELDPLATRRLNLLLHPIAVGQGLGRLFPADEPAVPLKLVNAETFATGVLNLSYTPAGA
jgi:hypothetical protein